MSVVIDKGGWGDPQHDQATIDDRASMRLVIQMPSTFQHERLYILKELLSDVSGVDWVKESGSCPNTVIHGADGKKLILQDGLFLGSENESWSSFRRPAHSITRLPLQDRELEMVVGYPDIPVLFGNKNCKPVRYVSENEIEILPDFLGGAFWLLTRMEELDDDLGDKHGRYPSNRQWLVESDLVLRAVVDEYRFVLNYCIKRLWPMLVVKAPCFNFVLSHDIDRPTSQSMGFRGFARQLGKDVIHRKAPWVAMRRFLSGFGFPGSERIDPGSGLSFLLATTERFNIRSCYYWMVPEGAAALDGQYVLSSGYAFKMLCRALESGHSTGLHLGYDTYMDSCLILRQVEAFRRVLDKAGAPSEVVAGRQHYLRWRPQTWSHYCHAGISRDASLGFADRIGFRCGTARTFHAFDLQRREPLPLIVEPLHFMDNAVRTGDFVNRQSTIIKDVLNILNVVHRFGGNFSILWHNNVLSTAKERAIFLDLLNFACED